MKKLIIISIFFLVISKISYSQWEFQYFVLKVGINHHIASPQPDTLNNLYINTPDGEMKMTPSKQYLDYVPGVNISLHFHLDFQNDKGGIVSGISFFNYGISAKYENFNQKYYLYQTQRINGIGIPFFVKLGNDIFNDQKYFIFGVQYNLNLMLQTIDATNWITTKRVVQAKDNQFISGNPIFFIGFNYMIFNFQIDFMPDSFLNHEYSVNVGNTEYSENIQPYKNQPDNLLYIETSINIPLSKWTTRKSYTINKITKRLKFWR